MGRSVLYAGGLVMLVLAHVCHTSTSHTSVWRSQSIRVEIRGLGGLEAIATGGWGKFDIDLRRDHLLVVSHVHCSAILLDLGEILHLSSVHVGLLSIVIVHAKHVRGLVNIRELLRAQTRGYGGAMRRTETSAWTRAVVV